MANTSEGCVFSHSDRDDAQEVSKVSLRGQILPTSGSSTLTGTGSSNFFKVYGHGSDPVAAPGSPVSEFEVSWGTS